MQRTLVSIVVLVIILLILGLLLGWAKTAGNSAATPTLIANATYSCDEGKTILASYYQGETKPVPSADMPPVPGGSVQLTLGDGRTMTLPQTISADGGRYANADESFIFWSKGNGAFVEEGGMMTYANCTQHQ
jgi:membrane-bound inhibitor of C-type lysozyme